MKKKTVSSARLALRGLACVLVLTVARSVEAQPASASAGSLNGDWQATVVVNGIEIPCR